MSIIDLLSPFATVITVGISLWASKGIFLRKQRFFEYFEVLETPFKIAYPLLSFGLILGIWSLFSYTHWINEKYLPTPTATLIQLFKLFLSGEIIPNALISLLRIFIGFVLASVIGVVFGSIAGTFSKFGALILPVNSSFRYIPPTAFISLMIIWFGIGETAKIAMIFIAIVFYITQMIADVVKLTPKVFIESAQMLGANRLEIFEKVVLQYSMPDILAVLRINLGAAWTFLIVSELVASQRGLGYLIATSQRFLMTPKLFALIIVVGLLGYLSDSLLGLIIKKVGTWRQ